MSHPSDGKLFVSYSSQDADFARRLVDDLRRAGVDVWLDQLDIPKGAPWDESIEEALRSCAGLLLILSPDSVSSQNVKDEISFALDKKHQVFPLLFRPCDVPYRWQRLQRTDFSADYDQALQQLMEALRGPAPALPAPEGETTQQSSVEPGASKWIRPLAIWGGVGAATLAAGAALMLAGESGEPQPETPSKPAYVTLSFEPSQQLIDDAGEEELRRISERFRRLLKSIFDDAVDVRPASFSKESYPQWIRDKAKEAFRADSSNPSLVLVNTAKIEEDPERCQDERWIRVFVRLHTYENDDLSDIGVERIQAQGSPEAVVFLLYQAAFEVLKRLQASGTAAISLTQEFDARQSLLRELRISLEDSENAPPEAYAKAEALLADFPTAEARTIEEIKNLDAQIGEIFDLPFERPDCLDQATVARRELKNKRFGAN